MLLSDERPMLSAHDLHKPKPVQDLEMIMKKEIFEDNKARWEVLEWMGNTQTKIIWAVAAALIVVGIVYLMR